jgi:hypothetical protein
LEEKPDFQKMRAKLEELTSEIGGKVVIDEYQTFTEGLFKAVYVIKYIRKNGQYEVSGVPHNPITDF